ncbi:hypothetical protein JCM14469_39160 [Desulfatiferula olefinivorans]
MIRHDKTWVLALFIMILVMISPAAAEDRDTARREKLLMVNLTGLSLLSAWGLMHWDYGERRPHTQSEGWFSQGTKEGGADKLGHAYSSYLFTQGMAALCEYWGYAGSEAALYGAASSFGLMGIMEVGDSFSSYGFSWEDFIMNTVGCWLGYTLYTNPDWARKVDFRIEYIPDFSVRDLSTDYENMKFVTAVKAAGFDAITDPWLKRLEFQIGYYARGYSRNEARRTRALYLAVGIGLAQVATELRRNRLSRVFNYVQIPYTYVPMEWESSSRIDGP